jgi:hypothetical protein
MVGPRRGEAEDGLTLAASLPPSLMSAVVVAILVAAGLAVLLHRLPATPEFPPPPAPLPRRQCSPTPGAPATAHLDAERLAREGRFAEAIHALLLRALAASGTARSRA